MATQQGVAAGSQQGLGHTPHGLLDPCSASLPEKRGALTSVGDEDSLVLGLHVVLTAVGGRKRHPVLAGMKLAVDLGAGPRQHLAEGKGKQNSLCAYTWVAASTGWRTAAFPAPLHA